MGAKNFNPLGLQGEEIKRYLEKNKSFLKKHPIYKQELKAIYSEFRKKARAVVAKQKAHERYLRAKERKANQKRQQQQELANEIRRVFSTKKIQRKSRARLGEFLRKNPQHKKVLTESYKLTGLRKRLARDAKKRSVLNPEDTLKNIVPFNIIMTPV